MTVKNGGPRGQPAPGQVWVAASALGTLAAGAGTIVSAVAAILALRAASAATLATHLKPTAKKSAAKRKKEK